MRITMIVESTLAEDGIDCTSTSSCPTIYDLGELSRFLTSSVQGAGWNYVVDVGIERDDGEVVFGNM